MDRGYDHDEVGFGAGCVERFQGVEKRDTALPQIIYPPTPFRGRIDPADDREVVIYGMVEKLTQIDLSVPANPNQCNAYRAIRHLDSQLPRS